MSFYPYRKEGGLILLDDKRYRTGNLHYFFLKIIYKVFDSPFKQIHYKISC